MEEAKSKLSNLPGATTEYLQHMDHILSNLCQQMETSKKARAQGMDPIPKIEIQIADDLADRVEQLLSIPVAKRIRDVSKTQGTERTALIIAEEIALGRFGYYEKREALDLAIRVGLAIITDGVTVAPLQGISTIEIKKNEDGSEYPAILFAGPMRSAGGTEAALTLVIADHVRQTLGLGTYHPNIREEDEVGRFIEELRVYEREVGNFQYKVSDEDIEHTLLHLPIEIDGVETDPIEVTVHRSLSRIATDCVRGGALRVLNDGIIGRCQKLLKVLQNLGINKWEWLADLKGGTQQGTDETQASSSHFEEVISGRPVLSFPRKSGGFRLRYGRARNTGLATIGVHPALAVLLNHPFVVGTQVKLDMPGKAGTIAFVDSIEPPIVKLNDDSVVKVDTVHNARALRSDLKQVLYLGDILISYGDFLENNATLPPSGYVEEWWVSHLESELSGRYESLESCAEDLGVPTPRLHELLNNFLASFPTPAEAFNISEKLTIPLHPRYLFYWDTITPSEILALREKLTINSLELDDCTITSTLDQKELLEQLGIPHKIDADKLVLEGSTAYVVLMTLGLSRRRVPPEWTDTCTLLSQLSGVIIKKKTSAFVGLRMGRPEKAMPRHMKPPVHVLFPIGNEGGLSRDITKAANSDNVDIEIVNLVCDHCHNPTYGFQCHECLGKSTIQKACPTCKRSTETANCPSCKIPTTAYSTRPFPLKATLERATLAVQHIPTSPLKGVIGLTNALRIPERLEKGILRHKHNLSVYKDGTVRFDATNVPLTHFKPEEIGITIEQLHNLGYTEDASGKELTSPNQLVRLFVQDVIISVEARRYFFEVTKFVDELLVSVYHQEPHYNLKRHDDLIGQLIVGLAPHTSVGIVGRVVGFTESQVCYAHPLWHSAKRRDCDGDGDSIILLLDALLNFSKELLPTRIGGLMDAPLLLQPTVIPTEVQRQAHNVDIAKRYPLNFYEKLSTEEVKPSNIPKLIPTVKDRLATSEQFIAYYFTHTTERIVGEAHRASYSTLKTLNEKLDRQIYLARLIRAVNPDEVVTSVLKTHLLPDILGNMRAYGSQTFRCKNCSQHYRRYPLKGVCLSCGGLLQGAVTRRSVEKYLVLATKLSRRFSVGEYLRSRIEVAKEELLVLFPQTESTTQTELTDFHESD